MGPRRRQLARCSVFLAVAVFGLGAVTAPASAQSRRPFDGLQLHPLWAGVTPRQAARQLVTARAAGADVVRADVGWSTLEFAGKGRWSRPYTRRLDIFLRNARRR